MVRRYSRHQRGGRQRPIMIEGSRPARAPAVHIGDDRFAPAHAPAPANPANLARMAKSKPSASKPQRRPRGEIDRNYFFGDVFIKTGVAVALVLAMIAAYTPVTLKGALEEQMYDYLAVMGVFTLIALGCYLFGRHLRREATHWDFD